MSLFTILLYFHIFLGSLALISGFIAAIMTKGSMKHKLAGATFHNSMLMSIVISLIIACFPDHQNPFLFSIGIFSSYSIILGKRCLKSIKPDYDIRIDRYLAILFFLVGITMIIYGLYIQNDERFVLIVFGIIAIIFSIIDYRNLKTLENYQLNRIKTHISKITGGYIASVTAFVVVNQFFPGLWAWFMPGILGSIYATYYRLKVEKKSLN